MAIFGKAAGSDDKDLYAVILIRFDQTKAPVQDLHGGNHLQRKASDVYSHNLHDSYSPQF